MIKKNLTVKELAEHNHKAYTELCEILSLGVCYSGRVADFEEQMQIVTSPLRILNRKPKFVVFIWDERNGMWASPDDMK